MKHLALAMSLFVVVLGAIGVIRPDALLGVARRFETPMGLYVAAAIRIVLGVALLLSADTSRVPGVIRVLGVVVLVAGVVTPFFGVERVRAIVDWWSSHGAAVMRAWAALALGFGAWLVWALASR